MAFKLHHNGDGIWVYTCCGFHPLPKLLHKTSDSFHADVSGEGDVKFQPALPGRRDQRVSASKKRNNRLLISQRTYVISIVSHKTKSQRRDTTTVTDEKPCNSFPLTQFKPPSSQLPTSTRSGKCSSNQLPPPPVRCHGRSQNNHRRAYMWLSANVSPPERSNSSAGKQAS